MDYNGRWAVGQGQEGIMAEIEAEEEKKARGGTPRKAGGPGRVQYLPLHIFFPPTNTGQGI